MLGRRGGEEFCVVLPGAGLHSASLAGERIRAAVEAMAIKTDSDKGIAVSATLGVASLGNGDLIAAPDLLLQAADSALYRAKAAGRNRVELDDGQSPSDQAIRAVG